MKEFKGIFPAIMTPFDVQGQVSEVALRKTVKYSLDTGVDGFYICGGGGEGLFLTVPERQNILEIVLDEVGGRASVMTHIGAFQIPDTMTLARHASKAGADAVASMPPAYFAKPNLESLVKFYQQIAGESGLPTLAYNIPGRVPINLDTSTFDKLIKIPGVIGLKDSTGDLYQLTLSAMLDGGKITVLNGGDQVLWYALMAGCKGGIGSTYPAMLPLFVQIYKAFIAGDGKTGLRLQQQVNLVIQEILRFDTLAAMKQILKWIDLDSGDPRQPTSPLNSNQATELKARLERIGFFDLHK